MTLPILLAALMPAAVAFVLLEVTCRTAVSRSLAAFLPALGYAVAYLVLFDKLPWPPQESRHWLFWNGLVLGAVAVAATWKSTPSHRQQFFFMLLMQAGLFIQLLPLYRNVWDTRTACLWTVLLVFALFATSTAFMRLAVLLSPRLFSLFATGTFSLLAVVLMVSGTASFAQLAGGAASALGGLYLYSYRRSLPSFTPAIAWTCAFFAISFLAQGHLYARVKMVPLAIALLAVPAAVWAASQTKIGRKPLLTFVAGWGLLLAAIGVALSQSAPLDY